MSDLFLIFLRCCFAILSVAAVGWIVIFITDAARDKKGGNDE